MEDAICLLDWEQPRSLPARYSDSFVPADVPIIFTTNVRPAKLFPRGRNAAQRRAIKRRYVAVEVKGPLQVGGQPFSLREKVARKEAGRTGPQGPGAH